MSRDAMPASGRVRLLSDLGVRDTVMTPTGRVALVRGFDHDAVVIQFQDDAEECTLLPHLLQLVSPAPRRPFPATFFGQSHVAA